MAKRGELDPQLQRLHVISAVVFAILTLGVWFLMKPTSLPLVVGHATKDELASQSTTVFAPAIHHLMDIDMRYALTALLVLAFVTSLLALTSWRKQYVQQLDSRLSPLTWISLGGILPALMVEIIAMFCGGQDVLFLKALVGLILLSGIFGWLAERENKGARRPQWLNFWLLVASGGAAWLVLLAMLLATSLYGMVRLPWFVYGLFLVFSTASLAALINLTYDLKKLKGAKKFAVVERNYLVINIFSKGLFALVLIIGLKK